MMSVVPGVRSKTDFAVCFDSRSKKDEAGFLGKYLHRIIQGSFGEDLPGHRNSSSPQDYSSCPCLQRDSASHDSKA